MVDTVPMRFGSFNEFAVLICDRAGAVAHFHLVKGFPDLPEWQARIRLDRAEYLGKERQLNPKAKRALVRFLESRDRRSLGGRKWAGVVSSWNFYNPQNPFDRNSPMPDYTRLPTDLGQDFDHGGSLGQETTGLPMIIYVTDNRYEVDNDRPPRVHVQRGHSPKINSKLTVGISISANPEIVSGKGLSARDLERVKRFIRKNRVLLLNCWNTKITLSDAIESLALRK